MQCFLKRSDSLDESRSNPVETNLHLACKQTNEGLSDSGCNISTSIRQHCSLLAKDIDADQMHEVKHPYLKTAFCTGSSTVDDKCSFFKKHCDQDGGAGTGKGSASDGNSASCLLEEILLKDDSSWLPVENEENVMVVAEGRRFDSNCHVSRQVKEHQNLCYTGQPKKHYYHVTLMGDAHVSNRKNNLCAEQCLFSERTALYQCKSNTTPPTLRFRDADRSNWVRQLWVCNDDNMECDGGGIGPESDKESLAATMNMGICRHSLFGCSAATDHHSTPSSERSENGNKSSDEGSKPRREAMRTTAYTTSSDVAIGRSEDQPQKAKHMLSRLDDVSSSEEAQELNIYSTSSNSTSSRTNNKTDGTQTDDDTQYEQTEHSCLEGMMRSQELSQCDLIHDKCGALCKCAKGDDLSKCYDSTKTLTQHDDNRNFSNYELIEDVIERFLASRQGFLTNAGFEEESVPTNVVDDLEISVPYGNDRKQITVSSSTLSGRQLSEVYKELSKFRPHSLSTIPSSDGYQDTIELAEPCGSKESSSCSDNADEDTVSDKSVRNIYGLSKDIGDGEQPEQSRTGLLSELVTLNLSSANTAYYASRPGISSRLNAIAPHSMFQNEFSGIGRRMANRSRLAGDMRYDHLEEGEECAQLVKPDSPVAGSQMMKHTDVFHDITNSELFMSDASSAVSERTPLTLTLSKSAVVFSDGRSSTKVDMSTERSCKISHLGFTGRCTKCYPVKRKMADIVSIDIEPQDKHAFVVFEPSFIDQGKGFYVSIESDIDSAIDCDHFERASKARNSGRQRQRRQLFGYPFRRSVCVRSCSVQCNRRVAERTHTPVPNGPLLSEDKAEILRKLDRAFVYKALRLDADKVKLNVEHASNKLKVMMDESGRLLSNVGRGDTVRGSDDTVPSDELNKLIDTDVVNQLLQYKCDLVANTEEVDRTIRFLTKERDVQNHCSTCKCADLSGTRAANHQRLDGGFDANASPNRNFIDDIYCLLDDLKAFHENTATQIEITRDRAIKRLTRNPRDSKRLIPSKEFSDPPNSFVVKQRGIQTVNSAHNGNGCGQVMRTRSC